MILIAGTLGYFLFPETNLKNEKTISKNLDGDQNVSNSNGQELAKPNINNSKSLIIEKKEAKLRTHCCKQTKYFQQSRLKSKNKF